MTKLHVTSVKNKKIRQSFLKKIWLGMVLLFAVAVGFRLTHLQVAQAAFFTHQSEANRIWQQIIRAPRGDILDRNGKLLAGNVIQYSWEYEENNQRRERRIDDQNLAMQAEATAPAQVKLNYQRVYPLGATLAHILGYVQSPQSSSDQVFGRAGLERADQDRLSGRDGLEIYERDALGQPTRLVSERAPVKGEDLQLSIDADLSQVAFDALGDHLGTVIISDPKTGKILTMISKPSFVPIVRVDDADPTEIAVKDASVSGQISPSIADALTAPNFPFLMRAVSALYPPGSVYKIVTALAGLEYGAVTADTQVDDEGVLKVGDFSFQNWYWSQYGRTEGNISLVRALARSNDIYFYKAAEWIGPQRLADFSRLLGLGKVTGVGLPGEQAGTIPDPAWKQWRFGEPWYLGDTYHMGIGQGDVLVTPLQVQQVMNAVATHGQLCQPQLELKTAPHCQELSLQEDSLRLVKEGLREVCLPGGTAFPFFTAPYEILCKTGTAEFGQTDANGRKRTHAVFTAAVSKQARSENIDIGDFQPDLIITVVIESDESQQYKEGSADAGPVAKTIADWWWQRHGVISPEPDNSGQQ